MCAKTTLDKITGEVVRAAQTVLGGKLDKVILYGSYARGDYDEESDIDIMVLADVPREDALRISFDIDRASGDLSLEHGVLVSVHVTDCATFYKFIDDLPFYTNVTKDGVMLYAA
jgi:predicted nucleotidyltransferase